MEENYTVRIIDDNNGHLQTKSALSLSAISSGASKSVDIPVSALKNSLSSTLLSIVSAIESSLPTCKSIDLSEISFTLGIDAGGGITILPIGQASVVTKSSISFKFTPKK